MVRCGSSKKVSSAIRVTDNKTDTTTAPEPPANFTLKLVRPGFGPAAELPP